MPTENQRNNDFQLAVDIARAGPSPPADEDLAAAASSLLDATVPASGIRLVRVKLAAPSGPEAAQRLIDALDEKLTVIGTNRPDSAEVEAPVVEVLVDTEYSSDSLATGLADVSAVEGVVVADIDASRPTPESEDSSSGGGALGGGQEALSIYRLDDHLIVTEDFGAVIERFGEAVSPDEEIAAIDEAVTTLQEEVTTVEEELESLRVHIETEVPSRQELEYIFTPGAERFDGEGTHSEMAEVVAELDREVGRWHSLREASLLERARWLLTGEVPTDDSTDQQ